jgi:pseudaminic acid cytidylyltransferase
MKLAIIPARGGSQRIKNKNIRDFCGKPLIHYSLAVAKESSLFDEIHVSTDSDTIKEIVEREGFSIPFLRDSSLADHHTPLLPVLQWVVREFSKRDREFTEVCLLMPTAPLLLASDLIAAHKVFTSKNKIHPLMALSTFPVPIEWAIEEISINSFSHLYPEKAQLRSQDLIKKYFDAGAFVFYSTNQLIQENTNQSNTFLGYHLSRARAVDIDDDDDFELAKLLYLGLMAEKHNDTGV